MECWGVVKGIFDVIFMVGGMSIKEMQEFVVLVEESNMDGIVILCFYFLKFGNLLDLVDFCVLIVDSVFFLFFYYYYIFVLIGGYFFMLEFFWLGEKKILILVGIKYIYFNIMEFYVCRCYSEVKYSILWGIDEVLLFSLVIGGEGVVGSIYNYVVFLYNEFIGVF